MTDKKLSELDIQKIEMCIFKHGKSCEVKIEHGKPVVVAISRKVMLDSKEDSNK